MGPDWFSLRSLRASEVRRLSPLFCPVSSRRSPPKSDTSLEISCHLYLLVAAFVAGVHNGGSPAHVKAWPCGTALRRCEGGCPHHDAFQRQAAMDCGYSIVGPMGWRPLPSLAFQERKMSMAAQAGLADGRTMQTCSHATQEGRGQCMPCPPRPPIYCFASTGIGLLAS